MKVELIAITQPKKFDRAEDLISYCARVSNPSNQMNFATSEGLLNFCAREKHWSIFEQVDATFEITTTRDIGRQIIRHRSFMFQEFSQRYAEVNFDSFEIRETRMQDKKNRQNSIDSIDEELIKDWSRWQRIVGKVAIKAYKWALNAGIAKEIARVILPEGLTPSVLYMKGNLRDWIFYVEVRTGPGTQKEHRLIAEEIKSQLCEEFSFLKKFWNI